MVLTAAPSGAASAGARAPPAARHSPSSPPPRPRATSRPSPCRTAGATTARCSPTFTTKYGIESTSSTPTAAPATRSRRSRPTRTTPGPQAPDVIDVGLSFGPQAKTDGLLQPYKVSTWDTIPATAKDADGNWYGDYYGVLAFEVNTAVVKNVPKDWADLLKPEYKGQVALAGDPTRLEPGHPGVWAAALANGGSLDNAQPGLDFFKQLNDCRQLRPGHRQDGDRRLR